EIVRTCGGSLPPAGATVAFHRARTGAATGSAQSARKRIGGAPPGAGGTGTRPPRGRKGAAGGAQKRPARAPTRRPRAAARGGGGEGGGIGEVGGDEEIARDRPPGEDRGAPGVDSALVRQDDEGLEAGGGEGVPPGGRREERRADPQLGVIEAPPAVRQPPDEV